jgi:hypothetical protein
MNYYYEDFTEDNYRTILKIAKQHYNLISYEEYKSEGNKILWRHDIDVSVHRARRLAEIEAEEGVLATYFVHLHSEHYNLLETEISRLIFEIIGLGHSIGLHFDPAYYLSLNHQTQDSTNLLKMEKDILERLFDINIKAFSYHNPEKDFMDTADEIAGMVNCYSSYFTDNYGYCSDSNGYWRFNRLQDVLESAEHNRIQVLTHPEWWTPEAMSPRDRISRCIDGRSAARHRRYDEGLERLGRTNVR